MEKVMEKQFGDKLHKYYTDELASNPLNIINQMIDSNIIISLINLEEDAEMDMKMYSGDYNLEYVLGNFEKMQKFTAPFFVNVFANKDGRDFVVHLKTDSSVVCLESVYPDLEMSEILGKSRPVG